MIWNIFGRVQLSKFQGYRTQNFQVYSTHHQLIFGKITAEIWEGLSIPLFSSEDILTPPKFKLPILVSLKMLRTSKIISTTAVYIVSTTSWKAGLRLDSIILCFGSDLGSPKLKRNHDPILPPRGGRWATPENSSDFQKKNFPWSTVHEFRYLKTVFEGYNAFHKASFHGKIYKRNQRNCTFAKKIFTNFNHWKD